jgi:ABC-2 type transport system ATP-binding protein
LDPESAKILKETLLDYVSKGKTVMISTHVLEIAEAISKRVAIMQGGKVVAEGSLEDLRSRTGAKDLEEAFLQVTGVSGEIQDLLTALKAL